MHTSSKNFHRSLNCPSFSFPKPFGLDSFFEGITNSLINHAHRTLYKRYALRSRVSLFLPENLLPSLTDYETRFNSYNHEICVNDAVIIDPENRGGDVYGGSDNTVSQIVSYCTRHVDKVSEVIAAMNISAAASVKTAGNGGGVAGSYIDSNTFKESNINFFCQVKVTNQVIMGADLLKFNDIPAFRAEDSAHFTKVYGDSFISGFIEGGELNAIISVKTSDKKTINSIKASLEGSFGKGKFSADIKGEGGKEDTQALSQSETTITVNWTGGKSDSERHPFPPCSNCENTDSKA